MSPQSNHMVSIQILKTADIIKFVFAYLVTAGITEGPLLRIRSYSGPHFPAFGLNTEGFFVSLRIQSECGKMRARITPNTDTFHAVRYPIENTNYLRVH